MDKLTGLMDGEVGPEDVAESLFLIGYEKGSDGHNLFTIIMSVNLDFEQYTKKEVAYLLTGYALGQRKSDEESMEEMLDNQIIH